MLIRKQPESLFVIVKFANKNAGRIPTAKEFAKILSIEERNASSRIKGLIDKLSDCFTKGAVKTKYINYDKLCTEVESAKVFLAVNQKSSLDNAGRISQADLFELIPSHSNKGKELFVKKCCKAGYLQKIDAIQGFFREGIKTHEQLSYLKLLIDER